MFVNAALLFVKGSALCQPFNGIIYVPNYTTRIRIYKDTLTSDY
jgi:hypothetical protein